MVRHREGMTLVELLVVIAVIALLAGIIFSSVSNMQSSHEQFRCMNNLRMIHTAASMYHTDCLGYPPFDTNEAERYFASTPTLVGGVPTWGSGSPPQAHPTGFWILLETTHNLSSDEALNCPSVDQAATLDDSGAEQIVGGPSGHSVESYKSWYESWYYSSYQNYDAEVDAWQYLPIRDATIVTGPGATRQLWDPENAIINAGGDVACPGMQRYSPSGETILTWCPHHREDGDGGRRENTLVLYLNGQVETKHRFVDWFNAPSEPWLYPRRDPDWW